MKLSARTPTLLYSIAFAAGLAACGGSDTPPTPLTQALDYHQDAKVLLDRYCTDCHQAGGIAPFGLTDYASAKAQAGQIKAAVMSGRMPPWMPADTGLPLNHVRKLRPEDRDALLAWVDQGANEGDPSAAPRLMLPPQEKVAPPRPDLTIDMGLTYQPNTKITDDYRCFVVDPMLAADRYIRATDVRPGNPRIVHHVILFEVPAASANKVKMKSGMDGNPGYTCFGGPGSNDATMLAGWAPGGVPNRMRDDEGMLIHKGSLVVMQVHYNNRQNDGHGDRTVATLELLGDKPAYQLFLLPIARPDQLTIKAGDPNATQTISAPVSLIMAFAKLKGTELVLSGNTPHMHTLGKRVATSVSDGPMLLEIPAWDFHWQQAYQFKEPISLRPSDTLVVECNWDNSYENQPIIDGQKQMPRDITWGEGTEDEMCISFLHIRTPLPTNPF